MILVLCSASGHRARQKSLSHNRAYSIYRYPRCCNSWICMSMHVSLKCGTPNSPLQGSSDLGSCMWIRPWRETVWTWYTDLENDSCDLYNFIASLKWPQKCPRQRFQSVSVSDGSVARSNVISLTPRQDDAGAGTLTPVNGDRVCKKYAKRSRVKEWINWDARSKTKRILLLHVWGCVKRRPVWWDQYFQECDRFFMEPDMKNAWADMLIARQSSLPLGWSIFKVRSIFKKGTIFSYKMIIKHYDVQFTLKWYRLDTNLK